MTSSSSDNTDKFALCRKQAIQTYKSASMVMSPASSLSVSVRVNFLYCFKQEIYSHPAEEVRSLSSLKQPNLRLEIKLTGEFLPHVADRSVYSEIGGNSVKMSFSLRFQTSARFQLMESIDLLILFSV